jgi:hypothetical protein
LLKTKHPGTTQASKGKQQQSCSCNDYNMSGLPGIHLLHPVKEGLSNNEQLQRFEAVVL